MTDQKNFAVFEADIQKAQARQRVVRIAVQVFLYLFLAPKNTANIGTKFIFLLRLRYLIFLCRRRNIGV